MMPLVSVLAVLTVVTGTLAQTKAVVPAAFRDTEAGGTWPLFTLATSGVGSQKTTQGIFESPATAAGSLVAIAFRPSVYGPPIDVPALSVELELGFGHASRPASRPSWFQAANRAQDFTTAISRKVFNFPAVLRAHPYPRPFLYRLPFDRGFPLRPSTPALWEMRLIKSSLLFGALPIGVDTKWTDLSPTNPLYPRQSFGKACGQTTAFDNKVYVSALAPNLTASIATTQLTVSKWPGTALTFIGTSRTSWGALRLPLDLTPFGAPGCAVLCGLEAALPGFSVGLEWAYFEVPDLATLVGGKLYFQTVRLRTGLNALDVVSSDAIEATIGPRVPVEVAIVDSPWPGFGGDPRLAGIGIPEAYVAPVFELELR